MTMVEAALRQHLPPVFAPMRAIIDRYHFKPPPGWHAAVVELQQRRAAGRRLDDELIAQSLQHIREAHALLESLP